MFLAECWEELFAGVFSGFVQEKGQKPAGAAHFLAALHSMAKDRLVVQHLFRVRCHQKIAGRNSRNIL